MEKPATVADVESKAYKNLLPMRASWPMFADALPHMRVNAPLLPIGNGKILATVLVVLVPPDPPDELVPVRLKVGQPPPPHPIRISKNSKISTIEQKTLRCTFMYILQRCHSLLTRQNAGPQQAANNCRSACAG